MRSDNQYVYALHSDTGQVAWRYRTWNFVRGSAALAPWSRILSAPRTGDLYALDVVNGTLRWKLPYPARRSVTASDTQ